MCICFSCLMPKASQWGPHTDHKFFRHQIQQLTASFEHASLVWCLEPHTDHQFFRHENSATYCFISICRSGLMPEASHSSQILWSWKFNNSLFHLNVLLWSDIESLTLTTSSSLMKIQQLIASCNYLAWCLYPHTWPQILPSGKLRDLLLFVNMPLWSDPLSLTLTTNSFFLKSHQRTSSCEYASGPKPGASHLTTNSELFFTDHQSINIEFQN